MKNTKLATLALCVGMFILMSSCSQQRFAYREKISVDQKQAQVQPQQVIPLVSKSHANISLPAFEQPLARPALVQSEPKQLLPAIQQMIPQPGSKASVTGGSEKPKEMKAAIRQLKRDLRASSSTDVHIDGMKWMIVGLIVMVVGIILSVIVGGLGGAVASIGGLIFLIGLVFYLLKILV